MDIKRIAILAVTSLALTACGGHNQPGHGGSQFAGTSTYCSQLKQEINQSKASYHGGHRPNAASRAQAMKDYQRYGCAG